MKKILTLLFVALAICGSAAGQQQSRLKSIVGLRYGYYIDSAYGRQDSGLIAYKDKSRGMNAVNLVNRTGITCDTIFSYMFIPYSDSVRMNKHEVFTYDTLNRMTGSIVLASAPLQSGGPYTNVSKQYYEYDTAGNMVKRTELTWTNNTWVDQAKYEYVFVNGLKTEYSQSSWEASIGAYQDRAKWIYSYDTANRLTMTVYQRYTKDIEALQDFSRNLYIINEKGTWVHEFTEVWDAASNTWNKTRQVKKVNDTMGRRYMDSIEYWYPATNEWVRHTLWEYLYDANGNPTHATLMNWDKDRSEYINFMREVLGFNAFNQVTHYQGDTWNDVTEIWGYQGGDQKIEYYYELYTPELNLKDIPKIEVADFKLYPVPANNTLNIEVKWAEAKDFYITITSLQGHPVSSWKANGAKHYITQIPLDNMANGNYFISINNGTGSITKQFTIVR